MRELIRNARILIFIVMVQQVYCQNLYKLVLLSQDRGASCLDGSPVGLYYHQGSQINKDKFMIYYNSGGFCAGRSLAQTLESCYKRSSGSLGSTKKITSTRNFDTQGLLSTLEEVNPVFYDWSKIYMIYCDGSQYTGSRKEPITYKDKQLYFRGYNNTMEQLRYLDQVLDIYNGEKIVITGVSAGGIATFLYSNYLVEHTKKAKIYAIPDSGLFITQFYSPLVGFQPIKLYAENLFKLILEENIENIGYPIKECIQSVGQDLYLCYNAANLAKYLKAPMLIVESPYDEYSVRNIVVAESCLTNQHEPFSIETCNETARKVIADYRKQTIDAIMKIKGNRTNVGVWAPACVQHGFTDMSSFADARYKVPSGSGKMVFEAIRQFIEDGDVAPWYLDEVLWPLNEGCNGMKKTMLKVQ